MTGPDDRSERALEHLRASAEVKLDVGRYCLEAILAAADLIAESFLTEGRLFLCGNGGSAADCQHMAAEFVSRMTKDFERPALPALALTTDTSFLTAFSNDCGFAGVFERQVRAHGRAGDVLIGISTSGSSANVVQAFHAGRELGMRCIALTGVGGTLCELAHITIAVPSTSTLHIQESHIAIEHIVCDLVEQRLFGSAQAGVRRGRAGLARASFA